MKHYYIHSNVAGMFVGPFADRAQAIAHDKRVRKIWNDGKRESRAESTALPSEDILSPDEDVNQLEEMRMTDAHVAYAAKHRIEIYNLGWGIGDKDIASKTSHGILVTVRDGNKHTHHFEGTD